MLLVALGALLFCSGFEWPGRVEHLRQEVARGDAATRRQAVQRLAAYPADDVRAPLLAALEDDDLPVRLEAAAAVGRAGITEATGTLLPWLADRDPQVRIAAVVGLGALADPSAQEALTRALSDALPSVRRAAAGALARVADAEALLALQSAIDDADPSVRDAVVRALRGRADSRALPALTRRVRDESASVREAVMETLGALRDPRALPLLIQGARDAEDDVELAAILAIGELGNQNDPAGLALLRQKLASEPRVAKAALSSLGRIDGAASLALLGATLDDPELGLAGKSAIVERVRRQVAQGGPSRVEPQLLAAVAGALGADDRPEQVGLAADLVSELSGLIPTGSLSPQLAAALREGRADPIRLSRALARTAAPEALLPLLERLARPAAAARSAADEQSDAEELERLLDAMLSYFADGLGDGRATDPLLARLATEPRLSVRTKLVRLIGWTRAPRALPALRAELARGDRALELAAIEALGRTPSPDVFTALAPLLMAASPDVRFAAARALAARLDADQANQLLQWLDGTAAADRGALSAAIGPALGRLRAAGSLPAALDKQALASFTRLASTSDPQLAGHALAALRHLAHPDSARNLVREFQSPRLGRRAAATFALASFPGEETRRLLRYTLQQHSSPRTTLAAALALGEVGDGRDAAALVRLVEAGRWPLPAAASYALRRLVDRSDAKKRSLERTFCSLTDHPNTYVRANVASALAALSARCPEVDPQRWLDPAEPSAVRSAAAAWLRALALAEEASTTDATGRALARCIDDPDPAVRAACSGQPVAPQPGGPLPSDATAAPPSLPAARVPLELIAYDETDAAPAAESGSPASPSAASGDGLLRERLIAVRLPDSSVFVGATDPNAQLLLPAVPPGPIVLEDPGLVP